LIYRLLLAKGIARGYSIVKLDRTPRTVNGHVWQVNHNMLSEALSAGFCRAKSGVGR